MIKRTSFHAALILALVFFFASGVNAQVSNTEDVVYLKNGTILRGKVIEFVPNGTIKVEIMGGSVFVYPSSEVEKIVNEPKKVSTYSQPIYPTYQPKPKAPLVYKNSGITNLFELGLMIGSSGGGGFISNSVNYILNPRLQIGAGASFERFDRDLRFLPVFLDIRGDLLPNSPVTPYYFGQCGYGFPIRPTSEWDITNLNGGINAGLGFGIKINTRSPIRWNFALAYKMQHANFTRNNWWGWPQDVNATLYRVSLRAGFSF